VGPYPIAHARDAERPWRRVLRSAAIWAAVGCAVGVVWFSGLMFAVGPIESVTYDGEVEHHTTITPIGVFVYATVAGLPWLVVGAILGAVAGRPRGGGSIAGVGAAAGAVAGLIVAAVSNPPDGWLVLTMPIYAFVAAFLGFVAGEVVAAGCRTGRTMGPVRRKDSFGGSG